MRRDAPHPGDLIAGKYRVNSILGRGRGTLVLAEHTAFEQKVAIRIVTPSMSDPVEVAKFRREARVLAKLGSEHVARILDVGVLPDGSFYLVRQYLEGTDLTRAIQERRMLPVDEAVGLILQATEAVAETHAYGILVRELAPEHLFLAERSPGVRGGPRVLKITDFGTAKILRETQPAATDDFTATTVLGLSPYSSPEMLRRQRDLDVRTDVWSLAAILYEMLSGQAPFGKDMISLAIAISRDEPIPLSRFRGDVPPPVEAAIRKALTKDKNGRPADTHAFAASLVRYAPPDSRHLMERIRDLAHSARARLGGGGEDEELEVNEVEEVEELEDPPTGDLAEVETKVGRPEDIVRRLPPPAALAPPSEARAQPLATETTAPRRVTQEKTEALGFNFLPSDPYRGRGKHAFAGAAAGLEPRPTQMLPAVRSPSQPGFQAVEPPKTTPPPPGPPPTVRDAHYTHSQPAQFAGNGSGKPVTLGGQSWMTSAPALVVPAARENAASNGRKVALFAVGGALAALLILVVVVIALPNPSAPSKPAASVNASNEAVATRATATDTSTQVAASNVVLLGSATQAAPPVTTSAKPTATQTATTTAEPPKSGDGALVVVAVGGTCAFTVNGVPKGTTNSLKLSVPPGSYNVACKPSTGATQSKAVTVKSGFSAMAMFKLN